jgi:hypothetical protein
LASELGINKVGWVPGNVKNGTYYANRIDPDYVRQLHTLFGRNAYELSDEHRQVLDSYVRNAPRVPDVAGWEFYDRVLPNLVKKLGYQVRPTDIPALRGFFNNGERQVHVFNITEEQRNDAIRRGLPLWMAAGGYGAILASLVEELRRREAQRQGRTANS